MGLLNETQLVYNDTVGNKGNYQFVSLDEIISSFMVVYVGEGKILSKASRTDVQFHGMRAIQELSYDILRSHKAYEIEVPNTLVMYLPQDYVNYTKIVRVDSSGVEKPLYPTGKTSNPFPISQNAETGASNGTFYIDNSTGFIHFSSDLAGKTITLKYISDGLGTDSEMVVHKFAEEAIYKHIMYGLISGRTGIPEYIVQRYKKERFAESRKAKIRLSNIKMEEFTQVLRGISKPIK